MKEILSFILFSSTIATRETTKFQEILSIHISETPRCPDYWEPDSEFQACCYWWDTMTTALGPSSVPSLACCGSQAACTGPASIMYDWSTGPAGFEIITQSSTATKTAAAPGAGVTSDNLATSRATGTNLISSTATGYVNQVSTSILSSSGSTTIMTGSNDGPSSQTIAIIASVCTVVGTAAAVATAWYARKGLKEKFKSVGQRAQRAFAFNNV